MHTTSRYTNDQSSAPLDWNFPSPTATPTTGSFGNHVFLTPKASNYSTHFQDAFTTPQMHSYATPQQPQYPAMTPVQRGQTSSDTLRSNYYANIQASGSQNGGQAMPPPGYVDQGYQMVSPVYGNTHAASMQLAMNTSFQSTQMQTPPPTRGASARKAQQTPHIAFGTPSTIASRRVITPQQAVVSSNAPPLAQHTPVQYPHLQFSPDMYQFANIGPASAPVMPQSRIFWAQNTSPMQPVPQATLDDPFAPATAPDHSWQHGVPQRHPAQAVSFDIPAMNSFPVQAPHPRPASAVPLPANYAATSGSEAPSAGVDPSLLYSSPMRPIVRTNSRTTKSRPQVPTNEAHPRDSKTPIHGRSDTISSTDSTSSWAPSTLQRSNTTGMARPKSAQVSMSAVESLNLSNSINQIPRTASPAKRRGRSSLGFISEGKPRLRTSVILTVDENGRARTETRRVDDSATRSVRERYPALFDGDSSDAESEGSEQTPSRPNSFSIEKRDERRSKAARLDPPVENLEGLTIPRSSSSASNRKGVPPSRAAVAAAAQLRRSGSLRRSTPNRSQNRRSFMSSSATSLIDTAPMDVSTPQQYTNDPDSPHHLIAQDHNDPFGPPSSSAESELDAHNRRWSMMSFEQHQPSQSISPQHHNHQSSPFAVPPQTRPLLIRCTCGVPNDKGQHLVQCQSCTQWLHAPCLGLDGQVVPQNFVCFLCTKPPSTASRSRSGAVRR